MNQTRKRTARTTPNGLPAMDDKMLAERCALIELPPDEHKRVLRLTVGLEPGKFGLLKRADRDWLMKIAADNKLLPRRFPKTNGPRRDLVLDNYSDKPCDIPPAVTSQLGRIPRPVGRRTP